jgi:hypothetical protein
MEENWWPSPRPLPKASTQNIKFFGSWFGSDSIEIFVAWPAGCSQSTISRNCMKVLHLLEILWHQLKIIAIPPYDVRHARYNIKVLGLEVAALIDGTHQPRLEPTDRQLRLAYWSGKEHDYTMLVIIIISPGGWIYYKAPSFKGSYGDIKIVKLPEVRIVLDEFLESEAFMGDKGFYGLQKLHPTLLPRKPASSLDDHIYNGIVSSFRYKVETVNKEIKEWKACAHRFRHNIGLHSRFYTVACGFVNIRRAGWKLNVPKVRTSSE